MMESIHEEDEEHRFFDACEESAPDFESCDSSLAADDREPSNCESGLAADKELSSFEYEVWTRSPKSVQERRSKFLNWMGLKSTPMVSENQVCGCNNLIKEQISRIMENSGAVLRTPSFEEEFSSSLSSISSRSNDVSFVSDKSGQNLCRIGNLSCETESVVDELGKKADHGTQVVGLNKSMEPEDFRNNVTSSAAARQHERRKFEFASNLAVTVNRVKKKWLSRLHAMKRILERQGSSNSSGTTDSIHMRGARVQRVKVRHFKKRWMELSSLFTGQDIQAHEGSILSMKFSLDGQYLATAGEDRVVRVWQVVEDARSNEVDVPETDPSCIYFTVNRLSELSPLIMEKEKFSILKNLRKTEDSACVIFPPRIFRILEEPLHQYHGHSSEVLDLSWSKNNCLLSSSVDKTVRLWQVGFEHCQKVYMHKNYVTCVQFNPTDSNYFISGSIDGKVRIWAIARCQVVDWTDIRDMVTAVSYRPDGKGVVVGSMTGSCRFYDISGDQFQLEAEICVHSKKKAPCKRITGFQFFPHDPSKLMVTCADSQVTILHGINVVGKYKGLRKAGNHLFASFTSDGKHVVSTCEDSNVYIWNCINQEELSLSRPKIITSWERFSTNALIAAPWSGLKSDCSENRWQARVIDEIPHNLLAFPSPTRFSLGQEFVIVSYSKGSATWPEEKLHNSSSRAAPSAMHKSQYKFLKSSCRSTYHSHAWGLVIVTAGWDGRIRSFHNYGLPVAL
ncbi:hypothetical protein NMG60_11020119 [Bertholletia excelsa]